MSSPSSAPSSLGKGSKGPPHPSAAPKGAGKSSKGPPPQVLKGCQKGGPPQKGYGKGAQSNSLPKEFRAPGDAARMKIQHALHSTEGTFWEGLDALGMGATGILTGMVLDHRPLLQQFAPLPPPPIIQQATRRGILSCSDANRVGVYIKGAKITPELASQAFTKDMNSITADQARALRNIAIVANEHHLQLEAAVQRGGIGRLDNSERLLLEIANIPMVLVRSKLVEMWHILDEETEHVRCVCQKPIDVIGKLQNSEGFRTVLQTILFVRNILGQVVFPGYDVKVLAGIAEQRLPAFTASANKPSVLTSVAKMLEQTHMNRCRLKLLRQMAVSRLVPGSNSRRLTWSYLNDLQETPWNAFELLMECSSQLFDEKVLSNAHLHVNNLSNFKYHELEQFQRRPVNSDDDLFVQQAARLTVCVDASVEVCKNSCKVFLHAAEQLCRLAGQPVLAGQDLRFSAASAMGTLRHLGMQLKAETHSLRLQRAALAARKNRHASNSQGLSKWMPVDTTFISLMYTTDLDVLREIREWQNKACRQTKVKDPKAKVEQKQKPRKVITYSDCMHGGIEGKYHRNPFTGSWGERLDGLDGTAPVDFKLGGPSADA